MDDADAASPPLDLALMHTLMRGATRQALTRHRRLGESIAVWRGGEVVTLRAEDIPLEDSPDAPDESEERP